MLMERRTDWLRPPRRASPDSSRRETRTRRAGASTPCSARRSPRTCRGRHRSGRPRAIAVGTQPIALRHPQPFAVVEAVVHERPGRDMRRLDHQRVALPAARREPRLRVRRAIGRVRTPVEENHPHHVHVLHFEHDQVASLIDLHRKWRLHVERDRRRDAVVSRVELLLIVVIARLRRLRAGVSFRPANSPAASSFAPVSATSVTSLGSSSISARPDGWRSIFIAQNPSKLGSADAFDPDEPRQPGGSSRNEDRDVVAWLSPYPARPSDPAAARRARGRRDRPLDRPA